MSTRAINFNEATLALQGNTVEIQFPLVRDETVAGNYATKYRYRYLYSAINCDSFDKDDYAVYNDEQWSYGDWNYIDITSIKTDNNGSFDFTVPRLPSDSAIKIEMQVWEDGDGEYYSSSNNQFTPVFVAIYNEKPVIKLLDGYREQLGSGKKEIYLSYFIENPGFCKPGNYKVINYSLTPWENYATNFINAFYGSDADEPEISIYWTGSNDTVFNDKVAQKINTLNKSTIYEWHYGQFSYTIELSSWPQFSGGSDSYFQISTLRNFTTDKTDFDFINSGDSAVSNYILIPADLATFQIKRRGVKSQMLEDDLILGAYSTGAGMFNHSNYVGVSVQGTRISKDYFNVEYTQDLTMPLLDDAISGIIKYKENEYIPVRGTIKSSSVSELLLDTFFKITLTTDKRVYTIETPYTTAESYEGYINSQYFYNDDLGVLIHSIANDDDGNPYLLLRITMTNAFGHSPVSLKIQSSPYKDFDCDKGHSIALYDTHVQEGSSTPVNRPSIGFMSDKHQCLAAIGYDPSKDSGRGALVSNKPIIIDENAFDDGDITPSYTSEIILSTKGGREVKIKLNCEIEK